MFAAVVCVFPKIHCACGALRRGFQTWEHVPGAYPIKGVSVCTVCCDDCDHLVNQAGNWIVRARHWRATRAQKSSKRL